MSIKIPFRGVQESCDYLERAAPYPQGEPTLDRMVTKKIGREDVEGAFHKMETSNVIRSAIRFRTFRSASEIESPEAERSTLLEKHVHRFLIRLEKAY